MLHHIAPRVTGVVNRLEGDTRHAATTQRNVWRVAVAETWVVPDGRALFGVGHPGGSSDCARGFFDTARAAAMGRGGVLGGHLRRYSVLPTASQMMLDTKSLSAELASSSASEDMYVGPVHSPARRAKRVMSRLVTL